MKNGGLGEEEKIMVEGRGIVDNIWRVVLANRVRVKYPHKVD